MPLKRSRFQVIGMAIQPVAVDMVRFLILLQGPAEFGFKDQAMDVFPAKRTSRDAEITGIVDTGPAVPKSVFLCTSTDPRLPAF